MGEVYEAEHVFLHRKVAVKILRPTIAAIPEALARMQREAESMSGLGSPHIVDVLDFGHTDDGVAFLVMEWLDGENLDDFLARERLDPGAALDLAAQAAVGLAEAHARGVIHRDLKPANLFVTKNSKGEHLLKVLDFGIAKLADQHTKLTATGVLVGTPNYMAPEQAMGDPVDVRADVYALGVILYEMLTGVVPFRADNPLAVLHQHTSKMPALPSAIAPERAITADLDELVMRCLAKRPEDRFASMGELGEAIDRVRRRPQSVDSAPARPRDRRIGAWPLATVALAIAAASIAIVVVATRGHARTTRRDAAVAAPAHDAASAAVPVASAHDAASAAVPVASAHDAAEPTLELHAKLALFSYSARVPTHTAPATPFDLAIAVTALDPSVETAARDAPLLARVFVRYYRDHSIVYQAAQPLGRDRRIVARVTTFLPGKHHVHVEILAGTRELGHATFDIFVGEDRAPEATPDLEHGHGEQDHQAE